MKLATRKFALPGRWRDRATHKFVSGLFALLCPDRVEKVEKERKAD